MLLPVLVVGKELALGSGPCLGLVCFERAGWGFIGFLSLQSWSFVGCALVVLGEEI